MYDNLQKLKELTETLSEVTDFNSRLIEAINTSHEGIAILDENGIYVWMNHAHEKMFGYNNNELIGKSWTTIYSPENVKWFIEHVFPILQLEGKWSGEAIAICKDGVSTVKEMVYLTSLTKGGLICTCRNKEEYGKL